MAVRAIDAYQPKPMSIAQMNEQTSKAKKGMDQSFRNMQGMIQTLRLGNLNHGSEPVICFVADAPKSSRLLDRDIAPNHTLESGLGTGSASRSRHGSLNHGSL